MTREEAKEALSVLKIYDNQWLREAIDMAIEALSDRPTGEWIIHDEVKNIYGGVCIECPECGTRFVTQTLEDERFCRNCGARMIREDGKLK